MYTINTINILVFIENIMGIYRNYSCLKRRDKYLIILRILIEMCVLLFPTVYFIYSYAFFLHGFVTANRVFTLYYISFQTANSLFALIWSPINSKHFKDFVIKIQKLFHTELLCKIDIKKRNKKFYCDVALFSVAMILMTLVYSYDSFANNISIFTIIEFVIKINNHYRYFYENFLFFELIELVIEPLKFLNESVSVCAEKLRGGNFEIGTEERFWSTRDDLEQWGQVSQYLLAATRSLGDCFGGQITLSLCSVTFYFIALLYDFVGYSVHKHNPTNSIVSTIFLLLSYLILKLVIVSAGQRVQNQADKLRRNIASLHNNLAGIPDAEAMRCARAAAELARRLRTAPLRVRLLSSLPVQMALLVDMTAVIANFTIVALQFNHVV